MSDLENISEAELERIFDQLSPVAQEFFIRNNVGKIKVPDSCFIKIVKNRPELFKNRYICNELAKLAHENNSLDIAIDLYIKSGEMWRAAWCADGNNMRARAIEIYRQIYEENREENVTTAAKAAMDADLPDLAFEALIKKKSYDYAIELAKEKNLNDRVIGLYRLKLTNQLNKQDFEGLLKTAEEWGLNKDAVEFCEEAIEKAVTNGTIHDFQNAARIADMLGQQERYKEYSIIYAQKMIDKELNWRRNADEFVKVAKLMKKFGEQDIAKSLFDKAIAWYIKDERFVVAARECKDFGQNEDALELYEKAIKKNETWSNDTDCGPDNFVSSGTLAEEAGLLERAIEYYRDSCNFNSAANIAFKTGSFSRAIGLCREGIMNNLNDYSSDEIKTLSEKIVEISEKGAASEGMQVFEEILSKALPKYENGKMVDSGYIHIMLNEYEKNLNTWAECGAAIAEELGHPLKAIEFFEMQRHYIKSEHITKSIDIAKKAGMYEKVIDLYCKHGDFGNAIEAAKFYGISHKIPEIGAFFIKYAEEHNNFKFAAMVAEEVGMPEKAALYRSLCKIAQKK